MIASMGMDLSKELARIAAEDYPVVLRFAAPAETGAGFAVCAVLCEDEGAARRALYFLADRSDWDLVSVRSLPR